MKNDERYDALLVSLGVMIALIVTAFTVTPTLALVPGLIGVALVGAGLFVIPPVSSANGLEAKEHLD